MKTPYQCHQVFIQVRPRNAVCLAGSRQKRWIYTQLPSEMVECTLNVVETQGTMLGCALLRFLSMDERDEASLVRYLARKAMRGTLTQERLTEPHDLVHADDGGCELGEGDVDVGAPIVAGGEASELGDARAKVRSTTHRCRPSLADVSTPRRAMRGLMERARQSRRHRRWSQAFHCPTGYREAMSRKGRAASRVACGVALDAPTAPPARRRASLRAPCCRDGSHRSASGRAACRGGR